MKKVITYNIYDLLSRSYYLFRRVKALGDSLIVGVTSDSFDQNVTYQKISQYISLFGVSGISTTEDKRSDRRKYEMQLCRDIIPIRIEEDYKFTRFLLIWKWRFEKLISWF